MITEEEIEVIDDIEEIKEAIDYTDKEIELVDYKAVIDYAEGVWLHRRG